MRHPAAKRGWRRTDLRRAQAATIPRTCRLDKACELRHIRGMHFLAQGLHE